MSKALFPKKLIIKCNNEEPSKDEKTINVERNKRKLLDRITNSYSIEKNKIKLSQNFNDKKNNEKKDKTQPIILLTESNEFNKQLKKAKEIKDLEKIYEKWNQQKVLSNIKMININNNNIKKNNDSILGMNNVIALRKIKSQRNQKILFDKQKIEDMKKKSFKESENKKFEEKLKIVEKIKNIKNKNKVINSLQEIKKIEERMEEELNIIKEKAHLFLDKNEKEENFIEKLELILIIGSYLKKEIKLNKNKSLITTDEAIYENKDILIKTLGYFGDELLLNSIKTYIEINPSNEFIRDLSFKILCSGLATEIIYKIIINNQKYKKLFEENVEKWFSYLENIKERISTLFNVPLKYIYFFGHKFHNFEVNVIIYNYNLNKLEVQLNNLDIRITKKRLLNNIVLSPISFEKNFCKGKDNWPTNNLIRGGKNYYPPYGWIGIGLKVKDKYDKDNIWLGKENKKGEWAVGYHGVGKGNVFKKILNIMAYNLKEGPGQLYKDQLNVAKNKDEYCNCGEGVYLSPNIEEAEKYADLTSLGWTNSKFKFVFMIRVNTKKIRSPGGYPVDWILNGNDEEIRPYRLLIKII